MMPKLPIIHTPRKHRNSIFRSLLNQKSKLFQPRTNPPHFPAGIRRSSAKPTLSSKRRRPNPAPQCFWEREKSDGVSAVNISASSTLQVASLTSTPRPNPRSTNPTTSCRRWERKAGAFNWEIGVRNVSVRFKEHNSWRLRFEGSVQRAASSG